jgi:hypothetical protein
MLFYNLSLFQFHSHNKNLIYIDHQQIYYWQILNTIRKPYHNLYLFQFHTHNKYLNYIGQQHLHWLILNTKCQFIILCNSFTILIAIT